MITKSFGRTELLFCNVLLPALGLHCLNQNNTVWIVFRQQYPLWLYRRTTKINLFMRKWLGQNFIKTKTIRPKIVHWYFLSHKQMAYWKSLLSHFGLLSFIISTSFIGLRIMHCLVRSYLGFYLDYVLKYYCTYFQSK
jgi:hypothetical protein